MKMNITIALDRIIAGSKIATSPNTAYALRAYALALRDIAPFGRNVVYADSVM